MRWMRCSECRHVILSGLMNAMPACLWCDRPADLGRDVFCLSLSVCLVSCQLGAARSAYQSPVRLVAVLTISTHTHTCPPSPHQ